MFINWIIELYETENGYKPIEDFFDSLNIKIHVKAVKEIAILKELGISIKEPYSKHLKDGVLELRIKLASDIARISHFFYVEKKIILTNGFIKKMQKTPHLELEKALKYKADYERRNSND